MERRHSASIATLFHEGELRTGEVVLEGDPLEHARARRLESGDGVRLADGRGRVADGAIAEVGKRQLVVTIGRVTETPKPLELAVLVPVADKDRMLFAAEKSVELQVTSWRPVRFARSRSVASRGEGPRFAERVRARMRAALEQSGGAWLPDIHEDDDVESALAAIPDDWSRIVLDAGGVPLPSCVRNAATGYAVGPEGGFEPRELELLERRGWSPASLAAATLRFETAIVAGAAVIRAMQLQPGQS